jgi:putative glycosyltransferase (TIGR04372 family)
LKIILKELNIKSRTILLINGIWGLPAVLIMRALQKFILIQLCGIRADRIGHFVADSAEQFVRFPLYGPKILTLYFLQGRASNSQWDLMVRRNLPNVKGNWLSYIAYWNKKIPGGEAHDLKSSLTRSRDLEGLFQKNDVAFKFTKSENDACQNWLKSKGWKEGDSFVTLLVRDSNYLQAVKPDQIWDYHSYRNSDIKDYIPAIEWLIKNRVWVLRMGRHTKDKLEIKKNRFVDYSNESSKSDLLDIWLFANATAIISTGTGLDYLGGLYRKPILFLNALPLLDLASYFNMTWVPKNLIWSESKEPFNFYQTIEHTYYRTNEYIENGIEIVNLTQLEIMESVKEFWETLRGVSDKSRSTIGRQKQFWKIFKNLPNYHEYHRYIHPDARVGSYWLSTKGDKFFE